MRRVRVVGDVPERFLGGSEDQLLGLGRKTSDPVRRELRLDSAPPQGREQIRDRGLEPRIVEVRRIDLDEQGPQLAHRVARNAPRMAEQVTQLRPRCRVRLAGRDVEAVRNARQVLDGPVVEIGCNPAPFDV